MDLVLPQPYHGDPGRSLSEEERREAAKTVTPIDRIRRPCQAEGDNGRYCWKRGGRG